MKRCHWTRLVRAVVGQLIVSVLLVQLARVVAVALGRVFASLWGGGPDRSSPGELVRGRYGLVPVVAGRPRDTGRFTADPSRQRTAGA